jgi:Ca-activated chloride channel family protein
MLAIAAALELRGFTQSASVQIASPTADSYLSGPTTLTVVVDQTLAPASVIFFADGRQTCVVSKPPFDCVWDAGAGIASHQIRVVVNLQDGQRIVQTVRTKDPGLTYRSQVSAVQVTVTVGDERRFVRGLSQNAFHVFEDDRPERIVEFASENVPLELVVALDISDSVKPELSLLKAAAAEFLTAIPATDFVTVIAFNNTIFPLTVRQANPVERVKALEGLEAWGRTSLYDAMLHGVDVLSQHPGRKVLMVFTDGEDQGSQALFTTVQTRLRSSEAVVYMVGVGRAMADDTLRKDMRHLSEPTGGRAIFSDKMDKLRDIFRQLVQELSTQYLLSYVPSNSKQDDTWRRIRVTVDGHKDVHAREGYRASSAAR